MPLRWGGIGDGDVLSANKGGHLFWRPYIPCILAFVAGKKQRSEGWAGRLADRRLLFRFWPFLALRSRVLLVRILEGVDTFSQSALRGVRDRS